VTANPDYKAQGGTALTADPQEARYFQALRRIHGAHWEPVPLLQRLVREKGADATWSHHA